MKDFCAIRHTLNDYQNYLIENYDNQNTKEYKAVKLKYEKELEQFDSVKTRVWTFLIYPTECPEFMNILHSLDVEFCLSPLHDKDLKKDGDIVKPHYHLMVAWTGPTTVTAVQPVSNMFNGTPVQPVRNVRALYHYFDHSRVEDKVKYNIRDIICGGGFDVDNFNKPTRVEMMQMRIQIENYIQEHKIHDYYTLCVDLGGVDLDLKDYADTHSIEIVNKIKGFNIKSGFSSL